MSYSAGCWSTYDFFSAVHEVSKLILHIWGRYVDSSSLISIAPLKERVRKLLEEQTPLRKCSLGVAPIHTEGLALQRNNKFDNDSYIPSFLESFDQQVFSALRAGKMGEKYAVEGPKHKKTHTLPFKDADVEVEQIVPGPLVVPNFESLIQMRNFDVLSWVSGENEGEVEIGDSDTTGVIVEDPLSDHEVDVSYARDASTQTICAHKCSQCDQL